MKKVPVPTNGVIGIAKSKASSTGYRFAKSAIKLSPKSEPVLMKPSKERWTNRKKVALTCPL